MNNSFFLTTTELLAGCTEYLESGGYWRLGEARLEGWNRASSRVFEDPYGVAAIVVYETWSDLREDWPEAQAKLVALLSDHLSRTHAKAWDGYLVLLTPDVVPSDDKHEEMSIRYDTSRVRKLVATGEELRGLGDLERALLPLRPLSRTVVLAEEHSILELLPSILADKHSINIEETESAIDAFLKQKNMLEELHEILSKERL